MKNTERLSLLGEWKLTGNKDGKSIEVSANLPGDFHSALLKNKIIPDPYYGFNEQNVLWVGKSDWTIERSFNYKKINETRTILELTQADTFFSVYINGKQAGSGKNQFARHRFDVSDFVKDGTNTIKILFESAERKAAEIEKALPYPVPCMKYDVYSPNRNLVRKCQCHGGWDWGPCLMVSGIYGNIDLITVADGIEQSLNYSILSCTKEEARVKVEFEYEAFEAGRKDFYFSIEDERVGTAGSDSLQKIAAQNQTEPQKATAKITANLQKGINTITTELIIKNPLTWKTSGELKELNLTKNKPYNLTLEYEDSVSGTISHTKNLYISTLKAVSVKEDAKSGGQTNAQSNQNAFLQNAPKTDASNQPGRSLYFENNGRRIFAKGSNWIPADALPSKMTSERYKDLLQSAVDANQNCIRVWGGGIYENDIFYELCDELGLIVWQDCMFACSTYPVTDDFLAEVTRELEYQIPRLKSHACIGIWCGNNENFGALGWFKESIQNRDRYIIDYDRLYNGLIGKKIKQLDSSRLYWPSSPCSGPDDFADNWHSDNMGDMHYWSVWHERKSFDAYLSIRPRFVSEFGYESFPSLDCTESFAPEKDFNFTSRVMEYHQRSPSGNSIIIENFSRYFRFPNGFENMIYLSQVQQAVAIKTAVDWWRSLNPHCMGTLIWQLNDVWPGPSWSSLEYSGKWKLLHYESRKFFENVYMPLFVKDGKLNAVICNDTAENLDITAEFSFLNFDGTEHAKTITKTEKVTADQTVQFLNLEIDLEDGFFIYATMKAVSSTGKEYTCTNTVWSDVYKHCNIKKATVQAEIRKIPNYDLDKNSSSCKIPRQPTGCNFETTSTSAVPDSIFEITLTTDKPAFFVSLDTNGVEGIFSDNMLTLLPNEPAKITFTTKKELSPDELKKALKIFDLSNC
ncbi:MAG: glycoside hydrolase family 2 protein [Treponema sp.]|nr:glycoside hydrolase family 2 protein [Treponema sp.]